MHPLDRVAETHGGIGDLDTAANYDVSMGGGTAVMDISVRASNRMWAESK